MAIKKVIGIALAVLVCLTFVPLKAQTVLLDEDFNGSWGTYANNPPAGWTINYTGSAYRNDWYRYYRGGSYCCRMYYYPIEVGVDELISPEIDCSAYGELWLAVDHYYDHYSGAYTAQWLGSTDGASSFPNIIWDYNQSDYGSSPFTRDSVDISSWAANESQVNINFYGDGNCWNINWWYIDNVMVYGWESGGPGGDLDLEMVQIIRPKDTEEGGVAFKPKCKIYNNTDADVEALVTCKIRDMEDWEYVYEEGLSNFVCNPGYTDCGAFKNFTPEGGKLYRAEFVVEHPDDIDPDNDHLDKRFTTGLAAQVDAVLVNAPTGTVYLPFAPSCDFQEMIGIATSAVWCRYIVEDAAFHAVVEEDSLQHDFGADDTWTATFSTVEGLADGDYTITFWATDERGTEIGLALEESFTYTGIAEELEVVFALDVVGSTISYTLGSATDVDLKVYDVAGNVVQTLVSGTRAAGSYNVTWDGDVSGVYFVNLVTREFNAVRKMTVLH